jgi:hypothetical protein
MALLSPACSGKYLQALGNRGLSLVNTDRGGEGDSLKIATHKHEIYCLACQINVFIHLIMFSLMF